MGGPLSGGYSKLAIVVSRGLDDERATVAFTIANTGIASGQMVTIQPGCVHTYTAIGGDVYALEYSPQRYKGADVTSYQ